MTQTPWCLWPEQTPSRRVAVGVQVGERLTPLPHPLPPPRNPLRQKSQESVCGLKERRKQSREVGETLGIAPRTHRRTPQRARQGGCLRGQGPPRSLAWRSSAFGVGMATRSPSRSASRESVQTMGFVAVIKGTVPVTESPLLRAASLGQAHPRTPPYLPCCTLRWIDTDGSTAWLVGVQLVGARVGGALRGSKRML